MISLEKTTLNDVQRIQSEYERLSVELSKLDTRKPTEKFLYSSLTKRMVVLSDKLKPLIKRLKYLKVGNGVQEDAF